jgi:hypothetical protein
MTALKLSHYGPIYLKTTKQHHKWRTFGRYSYYRPFIRPLSYTMRRYQTDPNGITHTIELSDYSKVSNSTPDYQTRKENGERLPQNPYQETRLWEHYPVSTLQRWSHYSGPTPDIRYLPDTYNTLPELIGIPSIFSEGYPPSEDIRSVLRQKLLSKLQDNRANIGEFIGEFGQTQRMFNNTIKRVIVGAQLISKRKFSEAVRHFGELSVDRSRPFGVNAKSFENNLIKLSIRPNGKPLSKIEILSNTWLEYVYGWVPLLSDITGTITALMSHLDPEDHKGLIKTVRKQITHPIEIYDKIDPGGDSNHQGGATFKGSTCYRICVSYRVTNENQLLRNQLGLLNPLGIAWNLLPYSFVVDWFFRVGDLIETLTATSGLAFIDGEETYIRTGNGSASVEYRINPKLDAGQLQLVGAAGCDTTQRQHFRNVLTDFPQPNLNRGTGLTQLHTANLLALLGSTFGRPVGQAFSFPGRLPKRNV